MNISQFIELHQSFKFLIQLYDIDFKNQNQEKKSHVSQQILTSIKESTLENWIYRAAKLGAPITLQLVKILASEIQSKRGSNYDEN